MAAPSPPNGPGRQRRGSMRPPKADAAFARAWLCGGESAPPDFDAAFPDRADDARPENLAQSPEKVESAPGNAAAREADPEARATADRHREPPQGVRQDARLSTGYGGVAIQGNEERPCAPGSPRFARDDGIAAVSLSARGDRPANPAQGLEKVESAPGNAAAREDGADAGPAPNDCGASETAPADLVLIPGSSAGLPREPPLNAHVAARAGRDGPENPAQAFEKVESAPGVGSAALGGVGTGPAFDERRASKAAPPGRSGHFRSENSSQHLDILDSAPGNGGLTGGAFRAGGASVARPAIPTPPGLGHVRMRLDGASASPM